MDASEAALLAPATQRLRQQREALQLVNADLKAALARKEELVRRLESLLDEATAERDAINEEVNRVLCSARTETINVRS